MAVSIARGEFQHPDQSSGAAVDDYIAAQIPFVPVWIEFEYTGRDGLKQSSDLYGYPDNTISGTPFRGVSKSHGMALFVASGQPRQFAHYGEARYAEAWGMSTHKGSGPYAVGIYGPNYFILPALCAATLKEWTLSSGKYDFTMAWGIPRDGVGGATTLAAGGKIRWTAYGGSTITAAALINWGLNNNFATEWTQDVTDQYGFGPPIGFQPDFLQHYYWAAGEGAGFMNGHRHGLGWANCTLQQGTTSLYDSCFNVPTDTQNWQQNDAMVVLRRPEGPTIIRLDQMLETGGFRARVFNPSATLAPPEGSILTLAVQGIASRISRVVMPATAISTTGVTTPRLLKVASAGLPPNTTDDYQDWSRQSYGLYDGTNQWCIGTDVPDGQDFTPGFLGIPASGGGHTVDIDGSILAKLTSPTGEFPNPGSLASVVARATITNFTTIAWPVNDGSGLEALTCVLGEGAGGTCAGATPSDLQPAYWAWEVPAIQPPIPGAGPGGACVVPVECGQELAGRKKKLVLFQGPIHRAVVLQGDAGPDRGIGNPDVPLTMTRIEEHGRVTPGFHFYTYSFETEVGETARAPASTIEIFNPNRAQVRIAVPRGPEGTIARKLYRNRVGVPVFQLLTRLGDNEQTEFIDNITDNELGVQAAPDINQTATVHWIARPPADWALHGHPIGGFLIENRLAAFAGHTVYVSSVTDHEDFLSQPLTFPIYSGEGNKITAAIYWRGQAWIFKEPRGIYRIDCRSLDPLEWQVFKHSPSVGCAGPMLVVTTESQQGANQFIDDVVFVDTAGVWHRLSKTGAAQEQDAFSSSISGQTFDTFIKERVDRQKLFCAKLLYFAEINELQLSCTERGASIARLRIKANLGRLPEFGIRFHHSTYPEAEGFALKYQLTDGLWTPFAGGAHGVVRALHQRVYTDAGEDYQPSVRTHDDSFGDIAQELKRHQKNYHWLLVEGIPAGDWPLFVDVWIDGIFKRTVQIDMRGKGEGFILDISQLDVDNLDLSRPLFGERRLVGRGRRIGLKFYTPTAQTYWRVWQFHIGYSAGGFSGAKST